MIDRGRSTDPVRGVGAAVCALLILLGSAQAGRSQDSDDGAAPAARLSVSVSPQAVRVGDVVTAVLTLETIEPDPSASFPLWRNHWGDAEIRTIGEVVRNNPTSLSQTLELTAFRPGVVSLPPVEVTLSGAETLEVSSGPAGFEVASVLPEGEEAIDPKPPAPPRPLPLGDGFWWTTGILSALAAGLLALLWARRQRQRTFAGEALDPWDALETALANLATAADAETVFTGLSLELRRYLGRALGLPLAESTTTELRRRLLQTGLPNRVCGDVVQLLLEADTVKFANKGAPPTRMQQCLEEARSAARDVRDFVMPAEEERESEAAA